MNVKKKKFIKAVLLVILIIILLLLTLLFFKGKSFSKYGKNINSSGIAEVAKPIVSLEGDSNILINGIEDTEYNFYVKNYDDTGISDVKMNYYIEIVNESDAKLNFELTKDGKSIELNKNKTELMSLSSLEKQIDSYSLKIKYQNSNNVTTDIDGTVQIKVEAIQTEK